MSEEPLFDPSLKKRKKKTVAFTEDPLGPDADPTAPAPETIDSTTISGDAVDLGPTTAHERMKEGAEDDFKSMFGDLKKKKKKKEIPMDFDVADSGTSTPNGVAPVEAAPIADDLDFSDIKKKKKSSKKKAAFDLEAFEKELNDSKLKEKKGEDEEEEEAPDGTHLENLDEEELGDDPFARTADVPVASYTFYSSLHAANPALLASTSGKRYTIAPPQVQREGNKKSIFANIGEICKRMHRQPEHVIQFLFAEMGTTGSVDGSQRLVIRGRFQQKQIENVLRRYIVEYVTCKTCKSPIPSSPKKTVSSSWLANRAVLVGPSIHQEWIPGPGWKEK
ncbi:domain found in IF2B/IF5-domain-containing protein [Cyathus striatus]|nr:domain found in IF2B/IF5-domain-containing protein [Cyathus striatus]